MIKPANGYLLVQPIKKETSKSGLYLPNQDAPDEAVVIEVGGKTKDLESPVNKGDTVIFKKWGGNEINEDGTKYQLLRFEDIIATKI